MMNDDFPDVTDPRDPDLPTWQDFPNLAGVATADLVEKIGTGKFSASYINWSRTLHLLRTHAPGWLPELVTAPDGGVLHRAPAGGFLLIRFKHADGRVTPEVPQAVMDHRNAAISFDKISARDITDTHRRGACMAAALTFGLAYELWAKMPLESGYAAAQEQPQTVAPPVSPTAGVWESTDEETREFLMKIAATVGKFFEGDKPTDQEADDAHRYLSEQVLTTDEKVALWTRLDSKVRSALKRAAERAKASEQKESA